MTTTPTLRQRQVEETRQGILRAARHELRVKGYARFDTARVADQANLAPRSIYRYFSTKDDLVWAAIEHEDSLTRKLLRVKSPGFLGLVIGRLTGGDPANLPSATRRINKLTKERP